MKNLTCQPQIDQQQKHWIIKMDSAEVRGWPHIDEEGTLRIWGKISDSQDFMATEIRPMPPEWMKE